MRRRNRNGTKEAIKVIVASLTRVVTEGTNDRVIVEDCYYCGWYWSHQGCKYHLSGCSCMEENYYYYCGEIYVCYYYPPKLILPNLDGNGIYIGYYKVRGIS